ncbi:CheR family methyltransferase [Pseudogulbenkiania sp. MAI-1]|uniref:CheR family methyltransferase n=1 Tax=Pseudogulbenkiania sp. MAI-1 TaxID=990370 RepID=UPI000684AE53|nr:CheR family methyltransferase [Pseudogulbenkiania sp. MAI-1]
MAHPKRPSDPPLLSAGPLLERLAVRIREELGLAFSGARRDDLARQLALAAHEQGGERPEQWLAELAARDWTPEQGQRLARYLTVGETYFLRDPSCFAAVRDTVLQPLVESRRGRQPQLRLWSAACCTGEEAYGLLFMVDELLGEERDAWRLELLASDLNPEFLARARRGVYGSYAFRQASPAWRARHFVAEGGQWRVAPAWRDRIRFFSQNLSHPDYPDAGRGLAELDLILCRNVLMYFAPEQAAAALGRLLACLAPDGVLLLSAVEAGIALEAGFTGSWLGDGYALRRQQPAATSPLRVPAPVVPLVAPHPRIPGGRPGPSPPPAPGPAGSRAALWAEALGALQAARYGDAVLLLERHLACPGLSTPEQLETCLKLAHACANGGRHEQAERWLAKACALGRLDVRPYWLLTLFRYEQGRLGEALDYLKKVRYLAPDFVLAPFFELQIRLCQGDGARAEQARRRCLELLAGQPDDAPVAEGGGLSVKQLRLQCLALGGHRLESTT